MQRLAWFGLAGALVASCASSERAAAPGTTSVAVTTTTAAPTTATSVGSGPAVGPEGDAFYAPPAALPDKPGQIIWWSAPLPGPVGSTMRRILYRSNSAKDVGIAVSGLLFVPSTVANDAPIMSYAHGTTGLDDRCAPSKSYGQGEGQLTAAPFLAKGFIVVDTDYEGLGTPGVHPYVVGQSEGKGVLDAIRAAREATGTTGPSIVWGHSQGGGAALWAAQLVPKYAPDAKVLGSVAGAPAAELRTLSTALRTSPFFGYTFMTAAGFKAAYPELDLSTVLTPKGVAAAEQAGRDCGETVRSLAGQNPDDYILADSGNVEPFAGLLEANTPGNQPTTVPIFVYQGEKDEQIPVATSLAYLNRACATGGSVILRTTYPGQSHAGVILAAAGDIQTWVTDRLAGKPAPSTECAKT